ncbi:MAG TPA: hypothetical protein VLR88_07970 [Propionibacteriaceae bacterium]|nr:hypothetical protein [Propionibacteriaceae bacterium]
MSDSISASLVINAPAEVIFAFLAHPANHQIFDASNMVGDSLTHGRIADVGQVFTMKMTWTDDDGVAREYVTDNHVTDFDEGRTIEWAPARQGREPWGWRWRYELEPVHHGDATRVTETHDWSRTSPENIEKYGVPEFTEADLRDSLHLLDLAVISGARAAE